MVTDEMWEGIPIVRDDRIEPGHILLAPLGAEAWTDTEVWTDIGAIEGPGSFSIGYDPSPDDPFGSPMLAFRADQTITMHIDRPNPKVLRILYGRSPAQRWNARCPSWLTVGVRDGRRALGAFPSNGRVLKLWKVRRG